jgi:hypothetical protein
MAKSIETEILIDAPPNHVWKVLMNFAAYSEWNPFIPRLRGEKKVGSTLTVVIEPPKKKPMTFQPKVLVAQENHEFRWVGHLVIPGIFDGEHIFVLEEQDNGTLFIQKEKFRGLLAIPMLKMIGQSTRHGFEEMNQALKERVEQME